MSWLLFLDVSGHDHNLTPYEVVGGVAIHSTKLWPFISQVQTLEQAIFGTDLRGFDLEIKGSKLLRPRCFKWAGQTGALEAAARRKHALNFLNNGKQKRKPKSEEFAAYGQACLAMAEGVMRLLKSHDSVLFATAIPCTSKHANQPSDILRKDLTFLLERYFYFLECKKEMGLLVMDGTEKNADRRLVKIIERYFTQTIVGRQRTQWIVPVPLFVESDMAYGVQAADLCIYCLNWGWRQSQMTEPIRDEIKPYVRSLEQFIWHGDIYKDGIVYPGHGVIYLPDPYESRRKAQ
jgi:uncharacterized protein DUF3800